MIRLTQHGGFPSLVFLVLGVALSPLACGGGSESPVQNTAAGNAAGDTSWGSANKGGQTAFGEAGGSTQMGDAGGQSVHTGGAGGSAQGGSSVTGKGGAPGVGGHGGAGGTKGNAGGSVAVGGGTGVAGAAGVGGKAGPSALDHFSFFVTSLAAIQRLSKSQKGFGGDLRFGKSDGLSGADEICAQIAESSMPGSSVKQWRAFLSVTKGPDGTAVNAIDRVGEGPWYDRLGRLVAATKSDLAQTRPKGADSAITNDLPNETGVPNHNPDGTGQVDNHDTLTGSDAQGHLYRTDWSCTCHDWTSSVGSDGKPRVGHTWPRSGGWTGSSAMESWISALDEAGCGAGINLVETGAPNPANPTVGSGGGYGGIYCLALTP